MTRRDLGTARWKRIRKSVLERDGYECQIGARGCTGQATTVDHIVAHNFGGGDDPGNLRAACRRCNSSLGHAQRGGGGFFDPAAPPIAPPAEVSLAGAPKGPVSRRTHRQVPE